MNYICASEYMSSHHVQVYTKLQCDKLPACVIAHLVEHSTTIVEVMVFIPVQA